MLVTESKPMYEKKTIADPANIPFTPYGKYLRYKQKLSYISKRMLKMKSWKRRHEIHYPLGSSYPTHPDLKPRYPPTIMMNNMTHIFTAVTMDCAVEL